MTALLRLEGHLVADGTDTLPAAAVATVKIVDGAGDVLAATAIEATENPVAWSVTLDPALVADPDTVLVWAMLRAGDAVWGTPELRPMSSRTTLVRVDGQ